MKRGSHSGLEARSRRALRRGEHATGEFLWLVSLSDLMILLFVFFVVLFSFFYRKMGPGDFRRMSSILRNENKAATPLDEIQARLLKWVVDRKLLDSVSLEEKEDALILHIKEKILFDSGRFELRDDARELLGTMGEALEKIPAPYRIGVEGHTDDTPIHSAMAADNWELSAKRAHSVLVALRLNSDLIKRAVILGYGEMKPIADNRDSVGNPIPANQLRNRRVTIRIF